MKVRASITLPATTQITVTITATLGELEKLQAQINTSRSWSQAGELLRAAIREAGEQVRATAEAEVEKTPENA